MRRLSGNALVMRRGDALFVGGDEDLDVLAVVAVILGYIVFFAYTRVCVYVGVCERGGGMVHTTLIFFI